MMKSEKQSFNPGRQVLPDYSSLFACLCLIMLMGLSPSSQAAKITSVFPAQGANGAVVTIAGSGFDNMSGVVLRQKLSRPGKNTKNTGLSIIPFDVLNSTDTQIVAQLKAPALSGPYDVDVRVSGPGATEISADAFEVLPPSNLKFNPTFVTSGTTVTLTGVFLGQEPGEVTLHTQAVPGKNQPANPGIQTTITEWNGTPDASPGTVVFTLPAGLPNNGVYDVEVKNSAGTATVIGALVVAGLADGDNELPHVVSALPQNNNQLLLQFNEPIQGGRKGADNPANYSIATDAGGTLKVLEAKVLAPKYDIVLVTTFSQAETNYSIKASNLRDLSNNPIAPRDRFNDPSTAAFLGIGPSGEIIDSDGDGLADSTEQVGWTLIVTQGDGSTITQTVTSDAGDPNLPKNHATNVAARDTDVDGVPDPDERRFRTDPRGDDSDSDSLTDLQELTELFSNPVDQDSDNDGSNDGSEVNFFNTSPILADTDGDQLNDGDEIVLGSRNPRVADIPSPSLEVGETNLVLDVRFIESTSTETRELDSKSVTSSLVQSESKQHSHTNSNTQEAFAKLSIGAEYKVNATLTDAGAEFTARANIETGWTGSWTNSWTDTSSNSTQNAYEQSLTTEVQATEGASLSREVSGAVMQATIFLESTTNLAYSIRNLQVTAFIQDPQDPTRLTPIATLLPDNEPDEGYTLGPLAPITGPFIFSNDTIFPQLVEQLMRNPKGLIFRISNFDIIDEFGRNFAFTSQEIVERTATLVIDNGSFDSDGDGEGELTEYHRVATGTGRVIDTNGNGAIDSGDRRVVFDGEGRHLGITLSDALDAIGLIRLEESASPTASLNEEQRERSYSTYIDDAGVERIFRIRQAAREDGVAKAWEIITPTGIDQTVDLDTFVLNTDSDIKLAFVQDIDEDGMTAGMEFLNNCSDVLVDTDSDGLEDRFEVLLGWEVDIIGRGARKVFSSCGLKDTDSDGVTDIQESVGFFNVGIRGRTDPTIADTDEDGVPDVTEYVTYSITLRNGDIIPVLTVPTNPDTDGDTASDGIERLFGGDPTNPNDINQFADSDGDGIVNVVETEGWLVTVETVSTDPGVCNISCFSGPQITTRRFSNPGVADTDFDGLLDGEERSLGTDPSNADTDGDGLTDFQEERGVEVRDLGILVLDPLDADTDNDKRSDGQEAELNDIELKRWVVRVVGDAPYRVFSDPLQADADFDRLADGDEFSAGSDPKIANTDGDTRDDFQEVNAGTRPLVDDFLVTLTYRNIILPELQGCDDDLAPNAGDFLFSFGANVPVAGTGSHEFREAITSFNRDRDKLGIRDCAAGDRGDSPCRSSFNNNWIQILGGHELGLMDNSVSFGVASNETFDIAGFIREIDDLGPDNRFNFTLHDIFRDSLFIDGSRRRMTFSGAELQIGTKPAVIMKDFGCQMTSDIIISVN